ncbi:hypothetical protein H0H92_006748 [Tricholoma furcatifolium]|nr:hypothetical protein H0H92_006748 [Tricholoma furcatifolium]
MSTSTSQSQKQKISTNSSPDVGNSNKRLRLLAIDGGGIRGLSSLVIIDEMMQRIQHQENLESIPKPCEYFDLIGGTSTGGIIAILLGRLRLSTNEAIEAYNDLAEKAFSARKYFWQDGIFKASTLTAAIQELVSRYDVEDASMMDSRSSLGTQCKTFVCAVAADNASGPRLFRSYRVEQNSGYNAKIWEAVRATCAAPTFFKRISVGSKPKEEFIDGGLRANNPVTEVFHEATNIWGKDCQVACIVNIGTGHVKRIKLAKPAGIQKIFHLKLYNVLAQIVLDCEKTATDFERRKDIVDRQLYYRLNVLHGLEDVGLAEWRKLSEVKTHTKAYLDLPEVGVKVGKVIEILKATTSPVLLEINLR